MKRLILLFLVCSSLAFSQQLSKYAPGSVIVTFKQDVYSEIQDQLLLKSIITSNVEVNKLFSALKISNLHNILDKISFDNIEVDSKLNRTFVLYLPATSDLQINQVLNELKKSQFIEEATPNALGTELTDPNDPYFNSTSQWNLFKIKMSEAWQIQKGSSTVPVAILDWGFQPTHQELDAKIIAQKDYTDIITSNYSGWIFDPNEDYTVVDQDATGLREHGTIVAQIAAGETNNGYGIAAVGWNTPLVLVRCGFQATNPQGSVVGTCEVDDVINALNWIRTSSTVKVINISFGWSSSPSSLLQTAINNCISAGIVVVAAAGNTPGGAVMYPAAYNDVIAVSGSNENDVNNSWSAGVQVSIVAPASNIRTMLLDGGVKTSFGTSLAAPQVSGTVALLISQSPDLTPTLIKKILEVTADKVAGMNGQNFHNYYGFGRLNVLEALKATNSIFTFTNKVINSDYGSLVVDENKTELISAGSKIPFKYETPHTSRTNELPFLYNYSGTTQKFNKWYQDDPNPSYDLSLSFTANTESPVIKDANFNSTVPVTIKNYFSESVYLNPSIDNVYLKDPWYFYKDNNNNWLQTNQYYQYSSPFEIQNNSSTSYGGVFLNQGYDPQTQVWAPPYYSVQVDAVQDVPLTNTGVPSGRNHKFYFQNWSRDYIGGQPSAEFQDSMALQTGVVFKQDNAIVKANLKGTQLSNTQFAGGYGQRTFVSSTNGYLHNVYESMGDIWYERSIDSGATWQIMNNGKPINPDYQTANAKSPSVCFDPNYNLIYVVYQGSTFPYSGIVLAQFYTLTQTNTPNWVQTIEEPESYSYSNNYKPVIAAMGSSGVVVYDLPLTVSAGIKAVKFSISSYPNYNLTGVSQFSIPGADRYSENPSITAGCQNYYMVYEQNQTSIRYLNWAGGTNPTTFSNVSSSSSYIFNVRPSISLEHCTTPIVSWVGGTYDYYHSGFYQGLCVMTRVGPNWGSINIFSANNASIVNNNSTTEYGTEYKSVIAYTYGSNTRWVKRENASYTTPAAFMYNGYGVNGIYPQISSAASINGMKALIFNTNSLPYYFIRSTTNFSGINLAEGSIGGNTTSQNGFNKLSLNDTIVTFGRGGVASINDIEFVFNTGDLMVDDSVISFIEMPDTLVYSSSSELNQWTRTNNFALTPNSAFYFSNIYYVVQKSDPDSSLSTTDNVNFKVELVNAITEQVVGTFDNITYNKNNLQKYASIDYEVDCSGITAGQYYLRLVTNVNGNANYALANIFNENTTLAKKSYQKVNFKGVEIPDTYSLEQNYPNPFNPNTTIRYQLPQNGMVTLKVYDILGAEVATLVNEEKLAGKYEVNFSAIGGSASGGNASTLASGVYIYSMQAGDFISSKKMILIK